MKIQDIKDCFDRVVPREELIADTVAKIDLMRSRDEKKARIGFGFSYRLATAMCALALVLGLGVMAMRDPDMVPHTDGGGAVARSIAGGDEIAPTAYTVSCELEEMAARAEAEGGEWIVFTGKVERCEHVDLTSEEKARGITYHYNLVFSPLGEDTIFASDTESVPFIHGFGTVSTELYGEDDEYSTIAGVLGGYSNIRIKRAADTWVVCEIIPAT